MRKKGLLPAVFFLFLSAGPLIGAERGFPGKEQEQDQQETPKFYALRVVFEKKVQNAKDSLGSPDGLYAEIQPGGQLVVLMESKIYPLANFDSGSVVSKGESDYGLEGWFQMQDTQGKQQFYWMPLTMGHSPGSFRISAFEPHSGSAGIDTIRIGNAGTQSLFVDAVIGNSREAERRGKARAARDGGSASQ
jgi:hypothetical protein